MNLTHCALINKLRACVLFSACFALLGCVSYHAKPLPATPDLAATLDELKTDLPDTPVLPIRQHRFDLSDGLDRDEVATLAVVNNGDLKTARDRAGVAHAQAFAAGLLPNPQLGLALDSPRSSDLSLVTAYSLGLSYDINLLIQRSAVQRAAVSEARRADLNLLWQEWQVVARARLLFVSATAQERALGLLQSERELFRQRYLHAQKALDEGNIAIDQVSAYLSALQAVDRRINDLERQTVGTRHDLNALLGLAPEVRLDLVRGADLPEIDATAIRRLLPDLPRRRPDLLALQAGYQAQEERLRESVLAQFPAFNLGITRARDTGGIQTEGLAIGLTLPLFNRNQGNIAIQNATRKQLYDEYQARLNTAYSDVDRILQNQELLEAQKKELESSLAEMNRVSAAAETAFREKIMDALHYTSLRTSLINKQIEAIDLERLLLEQRVALQTVIGGELPLKPQGKAR